MNTVANEGASAQQKQPKAPHSRKPWAILIWTGFLISVIGIAQFLGDTDPGFSNIITFVTSLTLATSWAVWLAFFSGIRNPLRLAPLTAIVLAICGVIASVRVDRFNGDMAPASWSWRWSKQPDEQVDGFKAAGSVNSTESPGSGLPVEFIPRATDFPRFLGPNGNLAVDGLSLDRDWVVNPPKLLWKQRIGAGWSSFSVVGDRAVTQEQRGEEELVTCYDVFTGKGIWSNSNPARFTSVEGGVGPRATPTIFDGKVYTVGALGLFQCLDFVTGKTVWKHDLLTEHNAVNLHWGKSNSPLIVDDKVIVSAGGSNGHSLVAYNRLTGELIWNAGDEQSSYASPVAAVMLGVKQVLTVNEANLASHDLETGEVLWQTPWPGSSSANASNSQPVPVSDDEIYISKGYFQGSALYRVSRVENQWKVAPVWTQSHMKTKHTNVVMLDGYVYGLDQGILSCQELASGEKKWKVRKADYGHGQILRVGNLILVQSEEGDVALVEANPEKFVELGRFHALDGVCWANFALSGDRLLLRNSEFAACYQLPLAKK